MTQNRFSFFHTIYKDMLLDCPRYKVQCLKMSNTLNVLDHQLVSPQLKVFALSLMSCQPVLISTRQSKVQTSGLCKLSASGDCVSLSAISVLCRFGRLLCGPEASGPAFVSSHLLCTSSESGLSPAVSPLSLGGSAAPG